MSRTPDFILKALNKSADTRSGKIGVAWKNMDGSVSLVLDVALLPDSNVVYTLFPNDGGPYISEFRKAPHCVAEDRPVKPERKRKAKPTMASLPVSVRHSLD